MYACLFPSTFDAAVARLGPLPRKGITRIDEASKLQGHQDVPWLVEEMARHTLGVYRLPLAPDDLIFRKNDMESPVPAGFHLKSACHVNVHPHVPFPASTPLCVRLSTGRASALLVPAGAPPGNALCTFRGHCWKVSIGLCPVCTQATCKTHTFWCSARGCKKSLCKACTDASQEIVRRGVSGPWLCEPCASERGLL